MHPIGTKFQAVTPLSGSYRLLWMVVQVLVFVLGGCLFFALVFSPKLGVMAFWNVLIPIAPLLFVLAVGVWRNICPLAMVAMLPHRFGFSKRLRIPLKWQDRLNLVNICLLFLIVPARHLSLNFDGLATAVVLFVLASLALIGGVFFDAKSLWCSGLCPIHPVEKLYGRKVAFTPPNAHCGSCHNCVVPCPDSLPLIEDESSKRQRRLQNLATNLLTGCLPGFIWGWFHVPDCRENAQWLDCVFAYALPWCAMTGTYLTYFLLRLLLPKNKLGLLINIFSALSISCYYWYRIPALLGYGLFPQDGLLLNLSQTIPYWSVLLAQVMALFFFTWWLVFRNPQPSIWAVRPPYLVKKARN